MPLKEPKTQAHFCRPLDLVGSPPCPPPWGKHLSTFLSFSITGAVLILARASGVKKDRTGALEAASPRAERGLLLPRCSPVIRPFPADTLASVTRELLRAS